MPEIGSTIFPGLRITGDGVIQWVGASASTKYLFDTYVIGDTNPRFRIRADGGLEWGSGSGAPDCLVYRPYANTIRVNDKIFVHHNPFISERSAAASSVFQALVTADGNNRFNINADGGVAWGPGSAAADCDLFRNAANELRSSDQLTILGGVATLVKAGVPGDGDFATAVDGLLAVDSANSDFYVRLGGAWKKVAVV